MFWFELNWIELGDYGENKVKKWVVERKFFHMEIF